MRLLANMLSSRDSNRLQVNCGLGNKFAPMIALWSSEIRRENPPLRRLRVRENKKPASREGWEEKGFLVIDNGQDRTVLLYILHIQLVFLRA